MTDREKLIYWRKYATQNAKYERNGVVVFRRAIANVVLPVARYAEKFGAQNALDSLDGLVQRGIIESAFVDFYLYVGEAHKRWAESDLRIRMDRKKRNGPPINPVRVAADPADSGFGAGFFNAPWLQKLKRLVYSLQAAKRVTSISNTIKKKLRGVLGRVIKEEVRPSAMAARIVTEMGGKFSEARAKLIARTESTFIANVAAKEAAMELMALGIELVKVWIDTRDARVRDTHWNLPDPIGFDEKFKIGDKLMDKPGDPDGGPEECCNCRCCVAYLPKSDYEDNFPKLPKLPELK